MSDLLENREEHKSSENAINADAKVDNTINQRPSESEKGEHTDKTPTVIGIIERVVEYGLRKIIFWENDDKRIGIIIRFFHNAFFYLMGIIYIINHTIMPSFILFVIFYFIYLVIWLQHIICGDCIIHHIEHRLIGDKKGIISPFMELFNINSDEYNSKILVMSSTLVIGMLTFEFISRTVLLFQNWMK
jgi:hypothetical protein